jgi:hypothetical protein
MVKTVELLGLTSSCKRRCNQVLEFFLFIIKAKRSFFRLLSVSPIALGNCADQVVVFLEEKFLK